MIFMDEPFDPQPFVRGTRSPFGRAEQSAHLAADTEAELLVYADSIGMPRRWLQHSGRRTFHFDLCGVFLRWALQDKRVTKLSRRDFARRRLPAKVTA